MKDSSESSEPQKGSLISVREAADANKDDPGPSDVESNGISNGVQSNGENYPMTTDTELHDATETDSMASLESGLRRKIKRNTVVPTDGEETSGRQTPDSELKKGRFLIYNFIMKEL